MLGFVSGGLGIIFGSRTSSAFSGSHLGVQRSPECSFRIAPRGPIRTAPRCEERRTTKKARGAREKQKTFNFATDIKGRNLWTLRAIKEENMQTVLDLLGEEFPTQLLESLVESSGANLVAEATLKPSRESESFRTVPTGCLLVDVTKHVADLSKGFEGGLEKRGELVQMFVDPRMGDVETVKSKLILGSMSKMKEEDVKEVGVDVAEDSVPFWERLGFEKSERGVSAEDLDEATYEALQSLVRMKADLVLLDPDPQMKVN